MNQAKAIGGIIIQSPSGLEIKRDYFGLHLNLQSVHHNPRPIWQVLLHIPYNMYHICRCC